MQYAFLNRCAVALAAPGLLAHWDASDALPPRAQWMLRQEVNRLCLDAIRAWGVKWAEA